MSIFSILKKEIAGLMFVFAALICMSSAPEAIAQTVTDFQNIRAIDPLIYDVRNHPTNRLDFSLTSKDDKDLLEKSIRPTAGELDSSFNVAMDVEPGEIRSSAKQPDGKLVIGGFFRTLNSARYKSIARLNTDNSLDTSFSAETNGTVFAIAIQSDGKILIGGSFTVVNNANRTGITRLNSDGSLDTTFVEAGADKIVHTIVLQSDGKILVGGNFEFVGNSLKYYVARLNVNGTVDQTFTSGIPPVAPSAFLRTIVTGIALQSDGKLLLIGTIVPDPLLDPTATTPIIRLNSDGSIDGTFNRIITDSRSLYDIAILPNDKILIGGFFTTINNIARKDIARLEANGSLDVSFDTDNLLNEPVSAIYLKPDGKILAGLFLGRQTSFIKQLSATGSTEINFVPAGEFFGQINSVNITANGKVFAGGTILQRTLTGIPNTAALFNPEGTQDTSFALNSTALGGARTIIIQPDGKMIVGGNFNRVNGVARDKLVRFQTDGTVDDSFPASPISSIQVSAMAQQPDGRIIIGGLGIGTGGFISTSIIRVNPDGSADSTFNETELSLITITALALQPDGKVLVAYANRSIFNNQSGGGIVRLNADGSRDNTFTTSTLAYEAIALQPDGKILAGGPFGFGSVPGNGEFTYGIVRLNSDGTGDATFRSGFDRDFDGARFSKVYSIKLKPDGKMIVGGELYVEGIAYRIGVARLLTNGTVDPTFQTIPISSLTEFAQVKDINLLPNGKILANGRFNNFGVSGSANIARFNADGSADNTFSAATDGVVYDIEIQNDGKVLIGGDFEFVNGVARNGMARLISEPIDQRRAKFDFDGDNKTDVSIFRPAQGEWWYLRSSDGGNRAFQFGSATDKIVPGDYTGDGKTDVAIWRGTTGEWFILRSEDSSFYSFPFGVSGDVPVTGDFDGDGKSDPAIFRPANATWYIVKSSGGVLISQFGATGDVPVVEDYDGDGKSDIAIFRPTVSQWWINKSSGGNISFQFGANGDKAVPADYTGDGKADVAIWRPSSGQWFVLRSEDSSFYSAPFGTNSDVPVAGDYDGDGRADLAVFRPSNNVWYLQKSNSGFSAVTFGTSGDKPVPSSFVP